MGGAEQETWVKSVWWKGCYRRTRGQMEMWREAGREQRSGKGKVEAAGKLRWSRSGVGTMAMRRVEELFLETGN